MSGEGLNRYKEAARRAMEWHSEYRKQMKQCRFDTIAVHGIYSMQEALDFNQGSIIEPTYLSSSQAYRDSDELEAALGYEIPTWCYTRIANPTIYYLEGLLALLESYGTEVETSCVATSSGIAAIRSAIDPFLLPDPKNHSSPINFVATARIYGGTYQLFSVRKQKEQGIEWRKVIHGTELSEWESLIDENTRFLYGELPSNPSQAFFDLKAVAELAHRHNLPLIIDYTVATPALLRPLEHGADIVVQSVTKSMISGGFGICGAVISRKNLTSGIDNPELKADFAAYLKLLPNRDFGPCASPLNAIMAINEIRTLRMKMDSMSRNTMEVAEFLNSHKHVSNVEYLGLRDHPLHSLASEYLWLVDSEFDSLYRNRVNRYGHLMSFEVKGTHQQTRRVFDALQRIWRATDLGRVKSIATIPSISTHSQQGAESRRLASIPDNLIRLGVGAEHPSDVIRDLDQALAVLDGKQVSVAFPEYSAGGASSAALRKG